MKKPKLSYFDSDDVLHLVISEGNEANSIEVSPDITAELNEKGELIGIVNAKIKGADNVSYAIKLTYLKNLIEVLPETVPIPTNQSLVNTSTEEKVKALSNFVVMIKIK